MTRPLMLPVSAAPAGATGVKMKSATMSKAPIALAGKERPTERGPVAIERVIEDLRVNVTGV